MLATDTSLGPYRIVGLIGSGGMGEVYRARDTRLERDVAIKVLPKDLAGDQARLRRFEQEARAAGALDHQNVCAIHDVGAHDGSPFVVMELLEGRSLRARLAAGPIPAHEAIDCAAQIALGLAAAHAKGIVHRDLKPENLFLTRDGCVKILDFGLARRVPVDLPGPQGELSTREMTGGTVSGAVMGTAGYMSPEQARGEPADPRSDIFSLGCVLHEMLSGHQPFKKPSAIETLSAILKEEPPPIGPASGIDPHAVQRIVARCLEKRPEARFASASDLHSVLKALVQSSAREPAGAESQEKSIVVLPFENLSPDPENAYFADGLTEEIIFDLARVRALRVISRTTAMLLRESKKDVPSIARDLKVRYALEGSVRRVGASLRITAQLLDAVTDTHLWAERYAGTVEDVFDMQEKVSRAIVEALKLELTPQEQRRIAERPIPDLYAFECYLKARREIWRFVGPSLDNAMAYLEQGLRVLPDNPLLLAGVGYVHFQRANLGIGPADSVAQAETFAARALEIAPDLPQAHVVLGLTATCRRGMIKTAIRHFEEALATDPNDPDALRWLGVIYSHVGRVAEAALLGERVMAVDPMSPTTCMPLVFARLLDGRFELALQVLERACGADPGNRWIELTKVQPLVRMGRRDEAIAVAESAERDAQVTIIHRLMLFWRFALAGERERALSWLPVEALETCWRDNSFSWCVACGYAMLGDLDSALDWLENAVELGFLHHRFLAEIDPILAPLRGDPRFQALMQRARRMQAELEMVRAR